MNENLLRLAQAAGIEERYWDGLGVQRDLHEATARALLDALGFDASGDIAAQLEKKSGEACLQALPPAVVVRADEEAVMSIVLPLQRRDETIAWELECEGGDRATGTFVASQLTQLEERGHGGQVYGRYRLALPRVVAGYHRFRLVSPAAETILIAAPARCYIPKNFAEGGRCWGFAVQLYAVRSARNWGIGDFSDLAALANAAGHAGASFIGLNPLHARHLVQPDEASPYAPSSRLFLDPVYIDVGAVDDLQDCADAQAAIGSGELQSQLSTLREAALVDYAAVTALKLGVLEKLFTRFRRCERDAREAAFREFRQRGGDTLLRFAEFEALRLHLRDAGGRGLNWRDWPEEYRDPAGAALARFRIDAAEKIEFQCYLQWQAAMQLQRAEQAARTAGMTIGLYRDVAVGAAHDSAETWSEQALFAHDVSVGAPPDMLNRQGQSWGLPPWKPRALAANGYAAFRRLLAANMRNAGALRIDHVMALTRLFWIPLGMSGADGGYVRNAFEELVAIVALESMRNRCMVIGEDLGSVPDGLRARLRDAGLLSYRVLVYERHWQGDGSFCHPHEYPPQSLATVATHDMPTMSEFWHGEDITRRDGLGMYPGAQQRDEEKMRREGERAGLLRLLGGIGLAPADASDAGAVIEALHATVARTASMLAVVQLDDLLGETAPINIPGTYREYPNWRRKLGTPIEALIADARWWRLAEIMRAAGRASPVSPA